MKRATVAGLVVALAWGSCSGAWAEISAAKIQQLVKDARILPKGYDVWPTVRGDSVEIKVNKNPKDTDKDLKINALLLGKVIMDEDRSINNVHVVFREGVRNSVGSVDERDTMVDATKANVEAYAAGIVDKSQLLGGMHLYVSIQAATTQAVIERSAGPGPLQSARMELINAFYMMSGKDKDLLGNIVPNVDRYAGQLQAIQTQAHAGQEAGLLDKINALKHELAAETAAFQRLPREEQTRQQIAYMRSHGIAMPASFATVAVATRSADGAVLSSRDYARLATKYPEYRPDESVRLQLGRRQQIGLKLMLLAENHQAIHRDWVDQFAGAEKLAKMNDTATLESRLTWLERALGLSRLSIMQPTGAGH